MNFGINFGVNFAWLFFIFKFLTCILAWILHEFFLKRFEWKRRTQKNFTRDELWCEFWWICCVNLQIQRTTTKINSKFTLQVYRDKSCIICFHPFLFFAVFYFCSPIFCLQKPFCDLIPFFSGYDLWHSLYLSPFPKNNSKFKFQFASIERLDLQIDFNPISNYVFFVCFIFFTQFIFLSILLFDFRKIANFQNSNPFPQAT